MGNYAWKTEHREGSASRKPNYSVKWEWKNPDLVGNYRQMTDLVFATNAERAINKVRRDVEAEYKVTRKYIIIVHAIPIDSIYRDV